MSIDTTRRIQRCYTALSHVDDKICSASIPLKRLCTLLCKDHVRITYIARQLLKSSASNHLVTVKSLRTKTGGRSCILPLFVDIVNDRFTEKDLRPVCIRTDVTVARGWVAEEFNNTLAI